ncbi:hypothetical protein T492DRAFT_892416 [Pavlovales sp. CCMP2436]|nr:hypothetical protein T492DRAFT_892416 [Pavlovales sp. CCMP2436]
MRHSLAQPTSLNATSLNAASGGDPKLATLHRLLRTADPKNTGRIDKQELRWVAVKSGIDLDDPLAANLVSMHDSRRDGQIRIDGFERGVRQLLGDPARPISYQLQFSNGKPPVDPGKYSSQGGEMAASMRASTNSMTPKFEYTRTLHTSQGLSLTRSQSALERNYHNDPSVAQVWSERGWN